MEISWRNCSLWKAHVGGREKYEKEEAAERSCYGITSTSHALPNCTAGRQRQRNYEWWSQAEPGKSWGKGIVLIFVSQTNCVYFNWQKLNNFSSRVESVLHMTVTGKQPPCLHVEPWAFPSYGIPICPYLSSRGLQGQLPIIMTFLWGMLWPGPRGTETLEILFKYKKK